MADSIKLRYGGTNVEFRRSDDLVAVKPLRGDEAGLVKALSESASSGELTNQTFGGFRIARLVGDPRANDQELDVLRANAEVAVGTHVFHTSEDNVPFVPTGKLFVEFKPGVSHAEKEGEIERLKLEIVESRDDGAFILKTTLSSSNPVKVSAELQSSNFVSIAEPEFATPAVVKGLFIAPRDDLLNDQWHLRNIGFHRGSSVGFTKGADARVLDAWERAQSLGSRDVIVAVIDDGCDIAHPDFAVSGKVVHPWDFTRQTDDPSPGTGDWHGTACAGVAVAAAGAGLVIGAAPASALMPVRWGTSISDTEIENWFGWVTKNGASVVSCSWGALAKKFALPTRAFRAIQKCASEGRGGKGCVVVFAAGNENHDINHPEGKFLNGFAVHPDVIAVAASTSKDVRSDYSNFGAEISVCAPSSGAGGWGILTSDVTDSVLSNGVQVRRGYGDGDYTYDFSGTSSACPLVAGVCALIIAADSGLSSTEIKQIVQSTARRIGRESDYDERGHSIHFGYGCIDAAAAVMAASSSKLAKVSAAMEGAPIMKLEKTETSIT